MSSNLYLNQKIFGKPDSIEKAQIRQGFGEGLLMAGDNDPQIVALCADLTGSTKMDLFAEEYPDRFFEMGIAEQNMAGVAAGMALSGKIPFMTSFASFNPARNWDQIRISICYSDANVKIVGSHAGFSNEGDGATAQALEDLALMRVLPNMTVLLPADAVETKKATVAAAKHVGPVYIRLMRAKTPIFTETGAILRRSNTTPLKREMLRVKRQNRKQR